MIAFWMCKLSPTEVADSDATNRNQLVCRKALTHDRASKVGRVSASRRALRVLIVNDEQDAADALAKLVRRWGHAAHSACDGAAALRVAAAQHPDVVLLDIAIPVIDGCQVARQLRLDFPRKECLIIAVTEHADERRRRQCSAAGIDLVLIKPVDPSVVETLLMLECVRMNRSQTDDTAGRATKGSSQFVCEKPSSKERDGAAEPSRSRKAAGAGADNNRRNCHETGGSSCWSYRGRIGKL